jgi:molecular chaperone GrpE
MMKKKTHYQEESQKKSFHKTTENKDNTHNSENNAGTQSDISHSEDPAILSSAGLNGNGATDDKAVTESRTAEEKLAEMQDKYIRLSAEFDNYRKRTLREKMDLTKYAGENIFMSIIPLMDDFDRALQHMDSGTDCVSIKNGIDLIYNKFSEFLKQNGIKEIESLNCNFNVDIHEAVAKVPVEDVNHKGKVVDVLQKGYYLQDKVLRFAKVVVGE